MKRFNWQVFISFNLLFTFLIMFVSGIVLYFKPEGSIARWLDWNILGLTKAGWESLHTIFSFVFLAFALFHILKVHLANLRAYFFNYRPKRRWRELYISLIITVVFLVGTIFSIPPFHLVFEAGNYLSDTWGQQVQIEHESVDATQKLSDMAFEMGLEREELAALLEENGYENISMTLSLKQNGARLGISPYELYDLIREKAADIGKGHAKTVYRTITLEELAVVLDVLPSEMVRIAENIYDLEDLSGETDLFEIAERANQLPSEVKDTIINHN